MILKSLIRSLGAVALALAAPDPGAWSLSANAQAPGLPSSPMIAPSALQAAASQAGVTAFYERHGWRAYWTENAVQVLSDVLNARGRHGLDRLSFSPDASAGSDPARREVALTKAALGYASALARGAVDPASVHDIYTIPRPQLDLQRGLAGALSTGRLSDWFEGLAPQNPEYQQLSEAYLRFSAEADEDAAIAATGLIGTGDEDPRVPAIREQLREAGYLPEAPATVQASNLYTQDIADPVRRLQRNYGLAQDGVVGPDTVQVLNLDPIDRARALAVALERRRWLDQSPPATRVDVNVAAARLYYYRSGNLVDSRKVIVGTPDNQTPALASPIYRLAANPTWTVPKSIQHGELANVGQAYLDSRNMVLRDGWIVQQPGPDNALGLVKFDMINPYAIYLHDTAAPALFARGERQLSHGCVRVEDALGFARILAEDQGVGAEWDAARRSGEHTFVDLPTQIPVRLLYHNVYVDTSGTLRFRMDPYGRNNAVAQALGFTRASGGQVLSEQEGLGP